MAKKKTTKGLMKVIITFSGVNVVVLLADIYTNKNKIMEDINAYSLLSNIYFIGTLGAFCLLPVLVPIKARKENKVKWVTNAMFIVLYSFLYYSAINFIIAPL